MTTVTVILGMHKLTILKPHLGSHAIMQQPNHTKAEPIAVKLDHELLVELQDCFETRHEPVKGSHK